MWKSIINELPADNQTVLVRILNIYEKLKYQESLEWDRDVLS